MFTGTTGLGKDHERSSGLCDINQLMSDCAAGIQSRIEGFNHIPTWPVIGQSFHRVNQQKVRVSGPFSGIVFLWFW